MEPHEDDDWYLDSIKRYGKLIMFESEDAIRQIVLLDDHHICVLSERKNNQRILSRFLLPAKLKLKRGDEGVPEKCCDLKLTSGAIPDKITTQIVAVHNQNKLFASQEGLSGLSLFKLASEEGEPQSFFSKVCDVMFPVSNPRMDHCYEQILIANSTSEPIVMFKNDTLEITYSLKWPVINSVGKLIPFFFHDYIFGICNEIDGEAVFYDTRGGEPIGQINVGNQNHDDGQWTVCGFPQTNSSTIGAPVFLSQMGTLKQYDIRRLPQPLTNQNLNIRTEENCISAQFSPTRQFMSVSGFDSNVYVFDVARNYKRIFTHDGHSHMDDCEPETITTSHLWYHYGGDDLVISGARNCSINCWQFNPE